VRVRTDVSALIVAGGRATRLGGVDKRELVVAGTTIFERQCAVLAPRVAEILVSSPRSIEGYRTVGDAAEGLGPLAGIAAGLAAATTTWLVVVAGDMPYLHDALIALMLGRTADAIDAVGIRIGGLPEPLCCVLRVASCLPIAQHRIAGRHLKVSGLLTEERLRVSWIDEAELRQIDPELRALFNINAPDDLATA
jgi:molybdenum cofactor guanylyltransferase